MKILLNIIWVVFGGLIMCIEYLLATLFLMITIIGIPFGLQTMKLAVLALLPFGSTVQGKQTSGSTGCLNIFMNVLWLIFGGLIICLSHVIFGIIFCITIIGIPFGLQHFKLAMLALTPFGKTII